MEKTIQRDWLKEAYEIAHGTYKGKGVKKEHVLALAMQIKSFENSFKILEDRMKELYNREVQKRKDAGLPPPPVPPGFQRPPAP